MKSIEVKGSSIDEALEKGLEQLEKTREQVDYEVLEKGGLLKKAKILITVKDTEGEKAVEFLRELFIKMNISVDISLTETDERAEIKITGTDSGTVIGYRGDVLDALQYVTSLAVNKENDSFKKIVLDCENYREKRTVTLKSLAEKLAGKAVRTGRSVSLEPMNPFERRIIHAALQDNEEVTTQSEGYDPNRHIIISPKNMKFQDRPFRQHREGVPYEKREGFGNRSGGYQGRDNRGEGDNRNRDAGGEGGYRNRDSGGEGGYRNRENRGEGGRDSRGGGFGGRNTAKKSSSFSSFGTYLGNTKSGFSKDTDFTKKSGFDNLKD